MDKERTPCDFTITQISHHGASNPIMARLFIQMRRLFSFTNFPNNENEINIKLLNLAHSLLKCWDIRYSLITSYNECVKKIPEPQGKRYLYSPYLENLEMMSEDFLYHSKNYLRTLAELFKYFWPDSRFKDALFIPLSRTNLFEFLTEIDPVVAKELEEDKIWISELIAKRNAVEHPHKKSGTLKIVNFQTVQSGEVIEPLWYREQNNKKITDVTSILRDISIYLDNLLTFTEDILVDFCVSKHLIFKNIVIYEIPEGKRNPQYPIRFDITLKPEQ